MKELDIDQFIEDGYVLIRHGELRSYSSAESAEHFVSDIFDVRRKMKRFFERPLKEKTLFEIGHARNPETNCYDAGWWRKTTYSGVDYPLEYYVSRNFYASAGEEICHPTSDTEEIRQIAASLPGHQTFSFASFMDEHLVKPLLRGFSLQCGHKPPSPSLQIQTTYYETQASLAKHRDRSFLEGIIGPATGVTIFPGDRTEKMETGLEAGDVILYTGRQFPEYFQEASKVPPPLPHCVEAEAGRMSLLFACWMPGFE